MNTGKTAKSFVFATCVAAALLLGGPVAADVKRGETLHANHCVSCHASMVGGNGSNLYTRADRKVNSRDQLVSQVNRCETTLGLGWFEEDVRAVVEYLDKEYYKF
jgi:mono/diheme cytochrome c family protein